MITYYYKNTVTRYGLDGVQKGQYYEYDTKIADDES